MQNSYLSNHVTFIHFRVVMAPKCPAPLPLEYYQKVHYFLKNLNIKNNNHHFYMQGVVYSVNAKSFQDSDKNGYGDLKGKGNKMCFKI